MPTTVQWLNPVAIVEQLVINFQPPPQASTFAPTGAIFAGFRPCAPVSVSTEDSTTGIQVETQIGRTDNDSPFVPLLSIIQSDTSTTIFSTQIKELTTRIISKLTVPVFFLTGTSPECLYHFIPVAVSILRTILSYYQSGGAKASDGVFMPTQLESDSFVETGAKGNNIGAVNPVSIPPNTLPEQHLIMALIGMWINLKEHLGIELFVTSIPVMALLTNLTWFDSRFTFTNSHHALFRDPEKDIMGFIEDDTIKQWWDVSHYDLSLSSGAMSLLEHSHALCRVVGMSALPFSKWTSVKMVDLSAQLLRSNSLLWDYSEPLRAVYFTFFKNIAGKVEVGISSRLSTELCGAYRVISTNTIAKPLIFQPGTMKREMSHWVDRLDQLETLRQTCITYSKSIIDHTDGTPATASISTANSTEITQFSPIPITSTPPCPFIASLPDDVSIYKIPTPLPLDELYGMLDAVGPAVMYEILLKERQFDLVYKILISPYRVVHEGVVAYISQPDKRVVTYNLYEIKGLEKALILAPSHFDYCQRILHQFIAIYTWPLLRMEREMRRAKIIFNEKLTWTPNPHLPPIFFFYNLFFRIINAYPPNWAFYPLIGYITPSYNPAELRRARETFSKTDLKDKTIINTVIDQQGFPFRHVHYNNMSPLPIQNALGATIANCLDMMCNAFFTNSLQCWWLNHLKKADIFPWYLTYTRNGRLLSLFSNVFAHTEEWNKRAEMRLSYEDYPRHTPMIMDQVEEQFQAHQEQEQAKAQSPPLAQLAQSTEDKKNNQNQLVLCVAVPDHSIPPEPFELAQQKYLVHPMTDLVEDRAFPASPYHYFDVDLAHPIPTPITYHPILEMSYFHGFLQDIDCLSGLEVLMEDTDKEFALIDERIKSGRVSKKFHQFPYEDVPPNRLDRPVTWKSTVYPLKVQECLGILCRILNDAGVDEYGAFTLESKLTDVPVDENGAPFKIKTAVTVTPGAVTTPGINQNDQTDMHDGNDDVIEVTSAPCTVKGLINPRPTRSGRESLPDLVVDKSVFKNLKSSLNKSSYLSHLWETAITKILSRSVWPYPMPVHEGKDNRSHPLDQVQQVNLGDAPPAPVVVNVAVGVAREPQDEFEGNRADLPRSTLLLLPSQKLQDVDTPHTFPVPVKPPVYLTLMNIYGTYLGLKEESAVKERDGLFDEPLLGQQG